MKFLYSNFAWKYGGVSLLVDEDLNKMLPETEAEYRSIANSFLEKIQGEVSLEVIIEKLEIASFIYRPDYWRRLRKGLELVVPERLDIDCGESIKSTKNLVTLHRELKSMIPKKQNRVCNPKKEDEKKLFSHLNSARDPDFEVISAIQLAMILGVRPAEMPSLKLQGDTVSVDGVKKREDRGLDRKIKIIDRNALNIVKESIFALAGKKMKPIQERLRRHTIRIWPKRKHRLSLYSWRHQMGSKLKASGMDRVEIAYIMGHRSTESVNRYGNKSANVGGFPLSIEAGGKPEMNIAIQHLKKNAPVNVLGEVNDSSVDVNQNTSIVDSAAPAETLDSNDAQNEGLSSIQDEYDPLNPYSQSSGPSLK